jgi:hypothetical protein
MVVRLGVPLHIGDMLGAVRAKADVAMVEGLQFGWASVHLRCVACSQQ